MEEFSYTISHDLRAPLRATQTYSEVLLEECSAQLGEAGRHYLGRIIANTRRLDKMVVDLLTYTRVSRSELSLVPVQLDRLAREIVDNYPGMQAVDATVEIAALGEVLGHEPSLVQAIANLLTNAIKFVAPGIRPQIKLWTELRGAGKRLWIEDNGIGVLPENQNRLFQMFERIAPTAGYEGNGVGLAIVRKAMQRNGRRRRHGVRWNHRFALLDRIAGWPDCGLDSGAAQPDHGSFPLLFADQQLGRPPGALRDRLGAAIAIGRENPIRRPAIRRPTSSIGAKAGSWATSPWFMCGKAKGNLRIGAWAAWRWAPAMCC